MSSHDSHFNPNIQFLFNSCPYLYLYKIFINPNIYTVSDDLSDGMGQTMEGINSHNPHTGMAVFASVSTICAMIFTVLGLMWL
jgi:hypothetical protein